MAINLSGTWGNSEFIDENGSITATPTDPSAWWSSASGSWPQGNGDVMVMEPFKGDMIFVNNAGQRQHLSFVVSQDGQTIMFGNGLSATKS